MAVSVERTNGGIRVCVGRGEVAELRSPRLAASVAEELGAAPWEAVAVLDALAGAVEELLAGERRVARVCASMEPGWLLRLALVMEDGRVLEEKAATPVWGW